MPSLLNLDDPKILTAQLIDIHSESHQEDNITTIVYNALRELSHLEVERIGNVIVARTHFNKKDRVILAGHLDTVPSANNIPHTRTVHDGEEVIAGLGAVDMKSGDAVFLHLAKKLTHPEVDLTFIFYDCEEVESQYNGLGKLHAARPELFEGCLAILGEPTEGKIEAGCQGSLRGIFTATGTRAHSARSWLGDNAIHRLAPVISAFHEYTPTVVPVDGLDYRESLSIVKITGGLAGNVIPDKAEVHFNYRYAPSKDHQSAQAFVTQYFSHITDPQITLTFTDNATGALPGLSHPVTQKLVATAQGKVGPKFGWTDVSRFSALGVPAVNLGPGDPSLCHKPEEFVPLSQIDYATSILTKFLT